MLSILYLFLLETDHSRICQFLNTMNEEDIRRLGAVLGILYSKLEKMKTLPDEMVAAWLRREDDVQERSGKPSWSRLADALQDIGQTGIATDIREKNKVSISVESAEATTGDAIQQATSSSDVISINNILSESESKDLLFRANKDVEKIKLNFATLQTNVRQRIGDYKNFATHVLSMDILSAHDAELVRNAASTDQIFVIIRNYWSLIDYAILKNIADTLLSPCHDHKQEMSEYDELLRQFCERRISELPPNFLSTGTDAEGVEKVNVTLNMDDLSLKNIKDIKAEIAVILDIPPSRLTICHIGAGSVIITFLIGAEIEKMFEMTVLSKEQVAKLKMINVVALNFRYDITTLST